MNKRTNEGILPGQPAMDAELCVHAPSVYDLCLIAYMPSPSAYVCGDSGARCAHYNTIELCMFSFYRCCFVRNILSFLTLFRLTSSFIIYVSQLLGRWLGLCFVHMWIIIANTVLPYAFIESHSHRHIAYTRIISDVPFRLDASSKS